jgi:Flp pilus assembly protein TadB
VIGALVLGAGFGLGLVAIGRGLIPPRPTLASVLAALDRRPPPPAVPQLNDTGWTAWLGRPFTALLAGMGLPTHAVRRDLAVLGRPVERHLAEKAAAALIGLALPPAVAFLTGLGGVAWPWAIPAWASLALGAAGFITPDLAVRGEAARRRAEFRHTLSAYLDLVVISLAGGAGVEAALTHAATAGSGWGFDQIRQALDAAQLLRRPPWHNLGDLGEQHGVTELVELAGSVALAGTEGAKVRASLAARAAGLRAHQLADAESRAQAATERLSLPIVLLFAGFLALIGFPAIVQILVGF